MTGNGPSGDDEHEEVLARAVLDDPAFLRLTATGRMPGATMPWTKVAVRPVQVKGQRRVQFSYFDRKKDTSRNYGGDELRAKLDELLAMPFRQFHLQSATGDVYVRISKRGQVAITRGKPSRPDHQPSLAHDRVKQYFLPVGRPDPFLHGLGLTDASGKPRREMHGKLRQIDEFLRLMEQVVPLDDIAAGTVEILDCGCGNAYLTFAAYHYFEHLRAARAHVIGIDSNEEVVDNARTLRDSLGWTGLDFRVSRIADFQPERPPDLVLSLHACDTATDEAIAQGVFWGSKAILAAPCCQHELHSSLRAPLFRPVLRHGILKQRMGDILTDAFRALMLRIMGYRTDVVQFVAPEHTPKNVMIRARKGLRPGDARFVREYEALKQFWGVEPCIERMVGEGFARYLCGDADEPKDTNGGAR
jgi:SAM-dependent methyltransferase